MPLLRGGSQYLSSSANAASGIPRTSSGLGPVSIRLTFDQHMEGRGEGVAGMPRGLLAAGTTLGKYQIVRLLGEGGMGAVYEGLHIEIGKRVAIKVLQPALAAIPEARARFLREAQLTSRVRHPHTVDVTDIGTESEPAVPGHGVPRGRGPGRRTCAAAGPLPLDEVVDIALPVLRGGRGRARRGHHPPRPQAAEHLPRASRDGTIQPKVLDFGISKAPPHARAGPSRRGHRNAQLLRARAGHDRRRSARRAISTRSASSSTNA